MSIQPADDGCHLAESVQEQRFLSDEAPGLPLPDCGAIDCRCRYVHHADRRGSARDRRLGPAAESDESEFWRLRERRVLAGRRQDDLQLA